MSVQVLRIKKRYFLVSLLCLIHITEMVAMFSFFSPVAPDIPDIPCSRLSSSENFGEKEQSLEGLRMEP